MTYGVPRPCSVSGWQLVFAVRSGSEQLLQRPIGSCGNQDTANAPAPNYTFAAASTESEVCNLHAAVPNQAGSGFLLWNPTRDLRGQ